MKRFTLASARRSAVLSASAVLCALMVIELVLALFVTPRLKRQTAILDAYRPVGELFLFSKYDPLLGYNGVPNVSAEFLGARTSQNSHGDRSPEVSFAKPAGKKRIVIVGDSQAWGFGVDDGQTIRSQLERLLAYHGMIDDEVINLGVGGYGTDQSLLQLITHGARFHPDLVIYIAFSNDPSENVLPAAWNVQKPLFYLKDDALCLGNIPPQRAAGSIIMSFRTRPFGSTSRSRTDR